MTKYGSLDNQEENGILSHVSTFNIAKEQLTGAYWGTSPRH